MTKSARFVLGANLLLTAFVILGLTKGQAISYKSLPPNLLADKTGQESIIDRLHEAQIIATEKWYIGDGESLLCIFQAFDNNPNYGGNGIKLSIADPSGKIIYEDYFGELRRVYATPALRKITWQLVIEVGDGGSMSFLQMFDYQDGKIVKLLNEKENSFDVNAEVRPQFRDGIMSGKEPFQILFTDGVGLASSVEKFTRVYRFKDGSYKFVGQYSQQKVDSYIEKLLSSDSEDKAEIKSQATKLSRH